MKGSFSKNFKISSSFKQFFFTVAIFGLGYGLYKGILDNYLAEVASMTQFDKGVSEFFREIPGLLLVFVLAIFYMFSAEKLYKAAALLMMAGMLMQTFVPANKILVIMAIFIYSLGEHIQLGMRTTLALEYSAEGKSGNSLGWMNSMYQAGNLIGFLAVIAIFSLGILLPGAESYKKIFFISFILFGLGAIASLTIRGKSIPDKTKSRFYFRKKFTKYYMLEVFYGARKQVFFTFGPYVLILFYGAKASTISILFALSAISSFILSPMIGRLIDRIGYKIVMISDTLILVVVCFFYGFAHHIFPRDIAFIVCSANYVLDAIISLASMASSVYVQDLADSKEEARATISTGISVNHLITIFIALFGGWIWTVLGIETLFIISAILGLCNSAYAATIKSKNIGERK